MLKKDAIVNYKEIWIYLQDMSKAYDRVNTNILTRLKRIQLSKIIDIIIGIFTNRKNLIITEYEMLAIL